MADPYIVPNAPIVTSKLPGTETWVRLAARHSGGALWNNGTFAARDIRNKPGQASNHARGLAMDLSYRFMPAKQLGVSNGRKLSLQFVNTCLANYRVLGIQLVIDYYPQPFGRSWRCDRVITPPNAPVKHRAAWRTPNQKTFTGAGGGDWWHIEITPQMGNDPAAVRAAFRQVFGVSNTATQ
jgi:hypothetical protein